MAYAGPLVMRPVPLFVLLLAGCEGLLRSELGSADAAPHDAAPFDGAATLDASVALDAPVVPSIDARPSGDCVRATEMWREDFEADGYARWTGGSYGEDWGDACQSTARTAEHPYAGARAQRSEIVCASRSPDGVHRGYGGLQFAGDRVLSAYTNTGTGLEAPLGIVTTFHAWLEAGSRFGEGRWVSLFTINPSCDYTQRVITLGIDQPDGILRAAHYWPEGSMEIDPSAPSFPLGRWVRVTVYVNLQTGDMHVWQDGASVEHVRGIVRTVRAMCQWHWGLYASGDNTDVVLYEDDKIVWRLEQPWTDWSREPWLGAGVAVCGG